MSRPDEMMITGHVKEGRVVFDGDVTLPEGTPVVVTVRREIGTPEALLAAMAEPPHLGEDDLAALLHEIGDGKRPIVFRSALD